MDLDGHDMVQVDNIGSDNRQQSLAQYFKETTFAALLVDSNNAGINQ